MMEIIKKFVWVATAVVYLISELVFTKVQSRLIPCDLARYYPFVMFKLIYSQCWNDQIISCS